MTQALEDAKELRAKYLALQEAEKKAQEELRTELKEMKNREMNAIENLQKASAKVEELQKELKVHPTTNAVTCEFVLTPRAG